MKKIKIEEKKDIKEDILEIILYYIIFFIISLPLKDLFYALKMSFIYTTFFILPFIFWFSNKNFVEKFFLLNLIGLTYSGIYVIMDVVFKIPLTKITFFVTTLLIFIFSILQKRLKNTSN